MLKLNNVYKKVALELGLNESDVKEAYNLYWEYFRKSIESLPLKENLNEEDFNSLKTSFNVPSLGKFYCTYDRYLRIKNKLKKSRNAKDKEV
jgi:hypothetical protein